MIIIILAIVALTIFTVLLFRKALAEPPQETGDDEGGQP